jgi:hypothetical protein
VFARAHHWSLLSQKICSNIILQPMPRSSKWSLPLRFSDQNFVHISHLSHESYMKLLNMQSSRVERRLIKQLILSHRIFLDLFKLHSLSSNTLLLWTLKVQQQNHKITQFNPIFRQFNLLYIFSISQQCSLTLSSHLVNSLFFKVYL